MGKREWACGDANGEQVNVHTFASPGDGWARGWSVSWEGGRDRVEVLLRGGPTHHYT